MANRFEWVDAAYARPSAHRRGDELADGNVVDKPYAIAVGDVVIQGTAPELRSLLQRAYQRLQDVTMDPRKQGGR